MGWNPLLDGRSHASSLVFPNFGASSSSSTSSMSMAAKTSTAFNSNRSVRPPVRQPPQSANYPNRNQVKFSFNLSEFGDEMDSLLTLPSPAISTSPGVFFDEAFPFPTSHSSASVYSDPQQRSPSLGIGSSLANEVLNDDDDVWRPSSVAHFQFPKSGFDLPYDSANSRAKSAIPGIQRPNSAESRDDGTTPSPTSNEDSENWQDWNIKVAPGCPGRFHFGTIFFNMIFLLYLLNSFGSTF